MSLKWNYFICFFMSLVVMACMTLSFKKSISYNNDNNVSFQESFIEFKTDRINLDKMITPNDNSHYTSDLIDFVSSWLNIDINTWHSSLIYFGLYVFLCTFILFNYSLIPYCYYRLWNWVLKDKTINLR